MTTANYKEHYVIFHYDTNNQYDWDTYQDVFTGDDRFLGRITDYDNGTELRHSIDLDNQHAWDTIDAWSVRVRGSYKDEHKWVNYDNTARTELTRGRQAPPS
jgi:hypothetical protein